jgi:Dna[CI] antecedent DciA-like protein
LPPEPAPAPAPGGRKRYTGPRRRTGLVPASQALQRWRRRSGAPDDAVIALQAAWPAAAGAEVAARSLPLRLSKAGVLTVGCASATWAQELGACEELLRERLAAAAPEVAARLARLRFAPADHAMLARHPAPAPPPPPAPSPAQRARAEQAAAQVADARLREVVSRAAAASMAAQDHLKSLQNAPSPVERRRDV